MIVANHPSKTPITISKPPQVYEQRSPSKFQTTIGHDFEKAMLSHLHRAKLPDRTDFQATGFECAAQTHVIAASPLIAAALNTGGECITTVCLHAATVIVKLEIIRKESPDLAGVTLFECCVE